MAEFNIQMVEQLWSKDSKIDLTDIAVDSSHTYELHAKYFKILNHAKKIRRAFDAERARMTFIRTDYYTGNITKATLNEHGWKPFQRVVLKAEVERYLAADNIIIELNESIDECNDIIDMCESILKAIHNRSFIIGNIIDAKKFENGGW